MPTYRLTIEYEGTRYSGWQEQRNARTVAGELRRAAEEVLGGTVELGGSGRTDAGVHALAQVAHLRLLRGDSTALQRDRTALGRDPAALRQAINERLPPDIHLLALDPAPDRFHARHAATARSYVYQVSRRRTAFAKRFVWWVRRPLDAGRMRTAAAAVAGRHDFAAFCERAGDQDSTLVVVERMEVAEAGALILIRVVASHFLWKMVRRLVGTLVEVGAGDLDQETFATLIDEGRAPSGVEPARWTAPPSGLFLERVVYPGEAPLGALVAPVPVAAEPVAAGMPPAAGPVRRARARPQGRGRGS